MYEVDREAEIIKYLPLVERVVQRLSIKTADYESGDLYNIGVIGLMDALRTSSMIAPLIRIAA